MEGAPSPPERTDMLRCAGGLYEAPCAKLSRMRLQLVTSRPYTARMSSIRLVSVTKQWASTKGLDGISL
ncbi:MAG: hypothetical protein KDH91_17205, partial [Rhodoferax sp.]|nr:hypothetical protein [Rhodoferax sp.]